MRKKLFRFFSFAAMVAVLIAVLKIINWLPSAIHNDSIRKYGSIEDIKLKLNIREIYIPSYFPQNFSWPPSNIYAQKRPFTAVIMEFKNIESGDTALIITQTAPGNSIENAKIKITRIKETIPYKLKDRNALLEVGTCGNGGELCSRISWEESRYSLNITAKYTPIELVKIAESMAH